MFMQIPLISGDTAATIRTNLKMIYSYSVGPPSVAAKYVTQGTVSGGVISLTVTDPATDMVLYVTAYGL